MSREQFEVWFENDVVGAEVTFPAFADGEYVEGDLYDDQFYFMLQAMWMSWKAATKQTEAKCAALAAENEAIKFYLRNGPVIRKGGELAAAHQFAPETPSTDAFLAEVRAQGVEMFAVWNNKCIDKGDEYEDVLVEVGWAARGFAAQLRQDANTAELIAAGIITKVGE